jgi:hypothetical protein
MTSSKPIDLPDAQYPYSKKQHHRLVKFPTGILGFFIAENMLTGYVKN